MKGFMLDDHGDVVIHNNKILMVEGDELLLQTVKCVLGTNKGEWPLNREEGINFHNILGKNKDEDMIKYEIQQGLLQVDNTFTITSFVLDDLGNRKFAVIVSAQNASGAELGNISSSYGTIRPSDTLIMDEEYEQEIPTESGSGYTDAEIRNMITQYGYQTSAQVQSAIKFATSGMYVFKGNVPTFEDLPANANSNDVYNVNENGMNYAWNGSEWDPLGVLVDNIPDTEIDAIINS